MKIMETKRIELMVNGEPHAVDEGASLSGLLERLELSDKRVAVERNGEIVPRSLHAQCELRAGDRLEIVHAIGGG